MSCTTTGILVFCAVFMATILPVGIVFIKSILDTLRSIEQKLDKLEKLMNKEQE